MPPSLFKREGKGDPLAVEEIRCPCLHDDEDRSRVIERRYYLYNNILSLFYLKYKKIIYYFFFRIYRNLELKE